MRNWLKEKDGRVVVVHCKAGKGRSGSISCSYLISEEGWTAEDALQRFTERRMKPGFGAGVSIPSQLRWISYVDRWTKNKKLYIERPVQILEVHIWGLRDGVKVAIEGYVDEGRTIKMFHTFSKNEREIVRGGIKRSGAFADVVGEVMKMSGAKGNMDLKEAEQIEKNEGCSVPAPDACIRMKRVARSDAYSSRIRVPHASTLTLLMDSLWCQQSVLPVKYEVLIYARNLPCGRGLRGHHLSL